jgi:hypothetical protein
MGRIKNKSKYTQDPNITLDDYVIGSDYENNGKTRNYSFRDILQLFNSESGAGEGQNNKYKLINLGYAYSPYDGLVNVSDVINNLPENVDSPEYKTIASDEIPVFMVTLTKGRRGGTSLNKYLVDGFGKGIYGKNGDITLTEENLILIESTAIGGLSYPPILNNLNAFVQDLGEIPDGDFLSVINSFPTPLLITSGTNWYFDFTVNNLRYLYGFDGINGTYGAAGSAMTDLDLFLVYSEAVNTEEIYNHKLNFSWGKENSNETGLTGSEEIIEYQNLKINIPFFEDISQYNPILLIDRFKSASFKGHDISGNNEYRKAGYKHERQLEALANGRQNEIALASENVVVNVHNMNYLQQLEYDIDPTQSSIRITGQRLGAKNYNGSRKTIYLGFRLRLNINGQIKETSMLGSVKATYLHTTRGYYKLIFNIT